MSSHRARLVAALFLGMLVALPACAGDTDRDRKPASPALPRLVDLGAGKCIPCKRMAPILEEMALDYAGIVDVVFLDVWKDPKAGKPYRIRVIPTQVFYDPAGREVFRHEGFFSREQIEEVFEEKFGVKPVARTQQADEKEETSSDLSADGVPWLVLGEQPAGPPLHVQVVTASFACACVMERCERLGRLLDELLASLGDAIFETRIDRVMEAERADSLRALWGLEELPAIALVDAQGRIYYGDDEELDLGRLRARIEASL